MIWSTSVLTTVSSDTEPTIVVQFESAKYIFNAGENTSRSWLQSRHRWKKARGLFLTSVGTQRGSGVPGMSSHDTSYIQKNVNFSVLITSSSGLMMFLADAGIRGLDIVGPPGMLHFLASMRSYLFRCGIIFCFLPAG